MLHSARRGAVSAGLIVLAVFLLLILAGGGCAVGRYNSMVSGQEKVDGAFSEIDNQYKRRNDLIPQLVDTVKGSKEFEENLLTEITQARASVGRAQLPSDPAAREDYLAAQQQLGGALSRLLVTVEAYPDLKASDAFRDLQAQVEGTENRITVARGRYIDRVKEYNTTLRKFPGNLVAGLVGFERMPQLEAATAEEREVPKIDFGDE